MTLRIRLHQQFWSQEKCFHSKLWTHSQAAEKHEGVWIQCEPTGCSFSLWEQNSVAGKCCSHPASCEAQDLWDRFAAVTAAMEALLPHAFDTSGCTSIVRGPKCPFSHLAVFSFSLQDTPIHTVPICNRLPEPHEVKITVIIIHKFPPVRLLMSSGRWLTGQKSNLLPL